MLEQRFGQVQRECDELYGKFVQAIHEVQQKSGFKNLLLEKKLTALADAIEKKVNNSDYIFVVSGCRPCNCYIFLSIGSSTE